MVLSREVIADIIKELKSAGKTIAFTNGCFDIIHAGHVKYLAETKRLADYLIVGINTDDSVRRLKGPTRPVNNESDRAEVLSALRSVDFVVMFDEDTPKELIEMIRPDVLVKGGDYTFETIVGAEFVQSHGGRVVTIPLVAGKSTTSIIERASCK